MGCSRWIGIQVPVIFLYSSLLLLVVESRSKSIAVTFPLSNTFLVYACDYENTLRVQHQNHPSLATNRYLKEVSHCDNYRKIRLLIDGDRVIAVPNSAPKERGGFAC
jgi:hypothetical protein